MRLPLIFRSENSKAARREREDRLERAMVTSLRTLAMVLQRAADLVESRRLERRGYQRPENFLERIPPGGPR